MASNSLYIAAAANRFPTGADERNSLIAFGSSSLIALWSTADDARIRVQQTLQEHEGTVTCVKFAADDVLISGDDKGWLRYWRRGKNDEWKSEAIQAHKSSITSICTFNDHLATGSSDSTVNIWRLPSNSNDLPVEIQALSMKGKYPLSLAMAAMPGSKSLILAAAGTTKNIQIWTRSDDKFVESATLSGHEDWIRCLAFNEPKEGEILCLASGSHDANIRLWNIEPYVRDVKVQAKSDDLLDAFEAALGDLGEGDEGGRQISLKRHVLTVKSSAGGSQQFSITFDALLVGHEAGVTSISWRKRVPNSSTPTLLSTSTDSSVILWSPSTLNTPSSDKSSAIWINRYRFGDIGGQRLGGFVGGLWSNDGFNVLAFGWSGGWRRWSCIDRSQEDETWSESGAITGHSGPVKDVSWSPDGKYMISAGLDQTTRIHGPISSVWHELGRPQVHGYDCLGAAFLETTKFVSISDEKVARVFEAPGSFVKELEVLDVAHFTDAQRSRPVGAAVPPLGLSNKATAVDVNTMPFERTRRPFEGELASTTLWPETEKVFGHGYESISLAVSNSRKLVATGCRASSVEHAVVRVYKTEDWQPFGEPLAGHNLTVTRIAFSPDDDHILTVSRDRSWRLFSRGDTGYLPVAADKSHGRIIWDCAWSKEGDLFATASRDKTVRLWSKGDEEKWRSHETIKLQEAATAVDFTTTTDGDSTRRYLAIGVETGDILVYMNDKRSLSWELATTISAHIAHITRLAWRPTHDNVQKLELASCSEDGSLRLSEFTSQSSVLSTQ